MKSLETWKPTSLEAENHADLSDPAATVRDQLDGRTSLQQVSERTGMDVQDVLVALGDLIRCGAVDPHDAPLEVVQLAHARPERRSEPVLAVPEDGIEELPELEVVGIPTEQETRSLPEVELTSDAPPPGSSPPAPAPSEEASPGSYRKLFETQLHPLDTDVREQWARTGQGDLLCALCFDPMPGVVQAVTENANATVVHARLIAEHHRNPVGLDAIGRRTEYLRDGSVRRLLMRNQQASERLLLKMIGGLPLPQVFRANAGHELTDRARRAGRTVLRRKFDQAEAEQKVGLIVQTEGRCLAQLVGLTFDQKTTALLCRRNYQSTMIIQNLARFPATPPPLLAHLLRQPAVVRNTALKKRLMQHPNCPKSLKR